MTAAFCSIVSALSRCPAGRHRLHRLVTMLALISTFLGTDAVRADAQEVIEYYAVDAIGSIRVVFAPDGTVKARSDYLPFGEEWNPATPNGPLPSQRFTGQQRDAEENLDYFNARSLQTRAGRFTAVDPVFAGVFNPQAWNRYSYALNNPLSYTDPTGMWTVCTTDETGTDCNSGGESPGGSDGRGDFGWGDDRGGNEREGSNPGADRGDTDSGGNRDGSDDGDDGEDGEQAAIIIVNPVGTSDPTDFISIIPAGPAAVATVPLKLVSRAFRSLFRGEKFFDPQIIRFTQNTIKRSFDDYGDVDNLVDGLRSGAIDPFRIPPIRLAEKIGSDGLLFSLDNRRLYAFKEAGVRVPYVWAKEHEIITAIKRSKISTRNDGLSIRVRGR